VSIDRYVWDSTHERRILVHSDEFSIVVYDLLDGPEISDVNLAIVDPEIVSLNISVDVASVVHLSHCLKHFRGDISYD
jgi:hypothetical protein